MVPKREQMERHKQAKKHKHEVQLKVNRQNRRLAQEGHWSVQTSGDFRVKTLKRIELKGSVDYSTRSTKISLIQYDPSHQVIEILARKLYWGMIELGPDEHQKLKEGYAFDVKAGGKRYFISAHTPVAKYEEKLGRLRYDRDQLVTMSELKGEK